VRQTWLKWYIICLPERGHMNHLKQYLKCIAPFLFLGQFIGCGATKPLHMYDGPQLTSDKLSEITTHFEHSPYGEKVFIVKVDGKKTSTAYAGKADVFVLPGNHEFAILWERTKILQGSYSAEGSISFETKPATKYFVKCKEVENAFGPGINGTRIWIENDKGETLTSSDIKK
jgi:hypothetical protein